MPRVNLIRGVHRYLADLFWPSAAIVLRHRMDRQALGNLENGIFPGTRAPPRNPPAAPPLHKPLRACLHPAPSLSRWPPATPVLSPCPTQFVPLPRAILAEQLRASGQFCLDHPLIPPPHSHGLFPSVHPLHRNDLRDPKAPGRTGGTRCAGRLPAICRMSTLATTECERAPTSAEPAADPAVLNLPFGLLGFEECKSYLVLRNPDEQPFMWLQMTDGPKQAFLVVPPSAVVADYQPELSSEDVSFLRLESPDDAIIVNIVTLRGGTSSTVNLKGPIVFNRHTRIGKQVIPLNASRFTLQHPLPALA